MDESEPEGVHDAEPDVNLAGRPTRIAAKTASDAWALYVKKQVDDSPKKTITPKPATKTVVRKPAVKMQTQGNTGADKSVKTHKDPKRKRAESVNTKTIDKGPSDKAKGDKANGAQKRLETGQQPSKKAKVSTSRPVMSKKERPHKAAIINDGSDSDSPVPPPPPPQPRRAGVSQTQGTGTSRQSGTAAHENEESFDDDGEDVTLQDGADNLVAEDCDEDDEVEPREECDDFDSERVTITGSGMESSAEPLEDVDSDDVPSTHPSGLQSSRGSRSSSVASLYATEPPTTDEDYVMHESVNSDDEAVPAPKFKSAPGNRETRKSDYATSSASGAPELSDEESDDPVVVPRGQQPGKLTKKQKAKLKAEVPEIRLAPVALKAKARMKSRHPGLVPANDTVKTIKWLSRTDIEIIRRKHSVKIDIKPQSAVIIQLIHFSYGFGDQMVVFGREEDRQLKTAADFSDVNSMLTPLEKDGLDRMAYEALVQAADGLGYGGHGDIAQRLEIGSDEDYAKPLRAYLVHHTEDDSTVPDKASLLKEMGYIYPWTSTDGFDRRALYESPVIKSAVRSAFFTNAQYHNVGLSNSNLFSSSMQAAPSEYEVSREMIALAMTAVESVISDSNLNMSKASEFGAPSAPAYREHIARLTEFRRQRPTRYHRVMHGIFKAATAGHVMHSSMRIGGTSIDWEDIPDE
ncbi:uncharacterized protein B0H18DRAFT_1120129 [Fomitopsis serialis]|uniref:uncharacterized protein n=1 Tax=Fomitopsis serialis TaxID=139415 RepID=UPI0020072EB0|nr:uncharacterized protein B0H18DRAFT_1120129 [Neoantrodia serialis]KAH9924054.1 hypothetical protein B0H18DRAFT_1120129 [Neoantrodia serialis]